MSPLPTKVPEVNTPAINNSTTPVQYETNKERANTLLLKMLESLSEDTKRNRVAYTTVGNNYYGR